LLEGGEVHWQVDGKNLLRRLSNLGSGVNRYREGESHGEKGLEGNNRKRVRGGGWSMQRKAYQTKMAEEAAKIPKIHQCKKEVSTTKR